MSRPADLSPARALLRAADLRPHRVSLVDASSGWTVDAAQSVALVRGLVALLRDAHVRPGDRVAVVAANSPWHFLLHTACAWVHAVSVFVSPRLPDPRLRELLAEVDPALVVTDGTPGRAAPEQSGAPVETLDRLEARARAARPATGLPLPCADEAAAVVFTSGSSGRPRGVVLTHSNLWWGSMCFRDGFGYTPARDVVGVCAPLSHIGGFNGTALDVFTHGGTVVVMRGFDPAVTVRVIRDHAISVMFAVPAMCHALLDARDRLGVDLSDWRLPLVGGDAMDASLAARMRGAGLHPVHVWGMTETSGAGTLLAPERWTEAPGSIGVPFPHVDLRLVDPSGAVVEEPGRLAEIQVRGPAVATRRLVGADTTRPLLSVSADGWLSTGDLARRDPAGLLHLVGRASRMIDTGGELVAPARVEAALRALPWVADALVVGLPDPVWGQVVAALAVPVPGRGPQSSTARSLRPQLAAGLAPWELPRRVLWVDALPRGDTGKPDVAAARALFEGSGPSAGEPPSSPVVDPEHARDGRTA